MSAIDRERLVARFWPKVNPCGPVHPTLGTECWLWAGCATRKGYGEFYARPVLGTALAHRVAWILVNGPVPEGLDLDHLCRVRRCVRPDHLEPVTNQENIRRGIVGENMRSKTHCPDGHPYEGDNLRIYNGSRVCATCRRIGDRARRAKRASLINKESP